VRPVPRLLDEEAYTVFCVEAPVTMDDSGPASAEDWLEEHVREIAALLTQEPDVAQLSEQESAESTGRRLSYYRDVIRHRSSRPVSEYPSTLSFVRGRISMRGSRRNRAHGSNAPPGHSVRHC